MKTTYKLRIFFVLVMLMNSCSSDKNALTKEYALEHLKQCEVKKPSVKYYNVTKNSYNVPLNFDETKDNPGTREYKHLMLLVKEGFLKADLVSASNANKNYDSYKFKFTEKSKEYLQEKDNKLNKMRFVMYETKVVEVESIDIVDEVKANVTVKYNKVKTPFYIADYDVSTNQNKPVKPDTYTATLVFRKSYSNVWKYCQ